MSKVKKIIIYGSTAIITLLVLSYLGLYIYAKMIGAIPSNKTIGNVTISKDQIGTHIVDTNASYSDIFNKFSKETGFHIYYPTFIPNGLDFKKDKIFIPKSSNIVTYSLDDPNYPGSPIDGVFIWQQSIESGKDNRILNYISKLNNKKEIEITNNNGYSGTTKVQGGLVNHVIYSSKDNTAIWLKSKRFDFDILILFIGVDISNFIYVPVRREQIKTIMSGSDFMFRIIPAIDLKNKKCVSLIQGIPGTERVSLENPLGIAARWVEEGAGVLHLIDLDGAIEGKRLNSPIIESIVKKFDVETQVGGGIRSKNDAAKLLDFGVDRVILGTAAVNNPLLVEELASEFGSERIIVALDSKNGMVTTHGWAKQSDFTAVELGKKFEKLGAGSILFTDINTEGLLKGVNPEPTRELAYALGIPVIASGGITTLKDIEAIKQTGAKGIVVGAALYMGNFTLREALEMEKN